MMSGVCLVALSGCGSASSPNTLTPQQTACTANQAMIGVGDGFLQNLCGCGGTPGQIITAPNTLTCTVSGTNTAVFFHYLGVKTTHQIASTGAPSFTSSPLIDPNNNGAQLRVHAVTLTASGTYAFTDLFESNLQGSIVVP